MLGTSPAPAGLGRSGDATTVTGGHQPMPRAIAGHIRFRHAPSHPETPLPQPTARPTHAAIPTQRRSTTSLSRQQSEQGWTTLVATWRLLSRLQVELARRCASQAVVGRHTVPVAEGRQRDAANHQRGPVAV
jgi:hypothetical protein